MTTIVHSKEAQRRFASGEWTLSSTRGQKLPEGYLINDVVPEEGEWPESYEPYVQWKARHAMVEVARIYAVTAKRRGLTINFLELQQGALKMAWRGDKVESVVEPAGPAEVGQ